jgi:hypothetical protein
MTIAEIHKKIALYEVGIKQLSRRDITPEKRNHYHNSYLTKIDAAYQDIQILIELKRADVSVRKRDLNLKEHDVKFIVWAGTCN